MGIFDRIHAFLWGNDREDADRSRQLSESETNPPMFPTPQSPDRELEDANGVRAEPTWEAVEWYLEKALTNKEDHVVLQLSYPKIPFIQACRDLAQENSGKMCLEVRVCDEQIKDDDVVILEKTVDADECRDAFRLYYESGEVRDLDSFSRESW